MIVFGAAVAVERLAPQMFFRIIALIAYILSILLWLSAWAYAASGANWLLATHTVCDEFGCVSFDFSGVPDAKQAGGALAACAALGAFAW
jgi:hypothetical protein